jgi:hypothetical protein
MNTNVNSKEEFIAFMESLQENLKKNPENWNNKTLPEYLEALTSWVDDREDYYLNKKVSIPPIDWKALADILFGATMYE